MASAPINWGIETSCDEGNPSVDELLQNSVDAGYSGFELGPLFLLGADATRIRANLDAFGLDAVAYWIAVSLAQPFGGKAETEVREALEILRAVGAEHLLVSDFGDPDRMRVIARSEEFPETWWSDDDWAEVRRSFVAIGQLGKEYGIDISVHPHVGGHIESGREIERVLEAIEGTPITVCIDTGHIRLGGTDSIPLIRRVGSRVTHIHAKDIEPNLMARLQRGDIDYETAVRQGLYCDLGDGIVDWDGFAAALDEIDFDGWVVAEEDQILVPGRRVPFESNIRNRAFLAELLMGS
ncbi:MAG: sugar phosphate isomerase/epimerase [Thermomicrobiales bacterium]|nr:sugar phosphate isomerase/epimerase [Thermomicrobiales bacterium]